MSFKSGMRTSLNKGKAKSLAKYTNASPLPESSCVKTAIKATGEDQPNCKWGNTCERVVVEFASHFNIPEGACPYPPRIPDIDYKP